MKDMTTVLNKKIVTRRPTRFAWSSRLTKRIAKSSPFLRASPPLSPPAWLLLPMIAAGASAKITSQRSRPPPSPRPKSRRPRPLPQRTSLSR